jgi:hypothetical protein
VETPIETDRTVSDPMTWSFRHARRSAASYFRENPLLCATIAAGAGFVLGGGLTTATTLRLFRRTLGLALQLAVAPLLLSRLRDALNDRTSGE